MAYRVGGYVGQAINIALTFVPGGGALMWAIRGAQALGGVIGGADAAINGDYLGAGLSLAGGLAGGVRGLSSCGAQSVVRGLFGNAGARLATRAASAAGLATRGLAVAGVGMGVGSAINRFASGDYVGALLDLGQAGASAFQASRACFTAEMLLDAEEGKKRADAIKVGDFLWSRSEYDPYGPIELKEVEEVFTRVSPILNVHVAGQIIRTTPEHPFRVFLKGWVPADMLEIGDLLMTRAGLLVPVEGVADSGQVETVYNWRIEEHHTYFVSATGDGASIWAHNAAGPGCGGTPQNSNANPQSSNNGRHRWSPSYREAGADSHHIIQDAAARTGPRMPGRPAYSRSRAPAEQLGGPSTQQGSPHYTATRVQDLPGGGSYGAERRIGYRALRRAGRSREEARAAIDRADRYFIDELGWRLDTPLSIPGNR